MYLIRSVLATVLFLAFSATTLASEFLFELSQNRPKQTTATAEQLNDGKWPVQLTEGIENRLEEGKVLSLALPGNRYIDSTVRETMTGAGLLHDDTFGETRIATLEAGQGTVEIYLQKGKIAAMLVLDMAHAKAYKAEFDVSGTGLLTEQDPDQYYCVRYPAVSPATQDAAPETADAAPTPDLDTLKHLQSKPGVANVLFINYWGGSYTSSAWNDGKQIDYTPFSQDADTNNFSDKERHDMWLGWAEAADDYAPFNINVTTDAALYAATPEQQRVQLIATTTCDWYNNCGAGGVAYVDVFGWGDTYGTGWVWNEWQSSLGMTLSHESGHQMGLHHDGNPDRTYESGHGDWGPIMGGPFGKSYVQWSKGEYPGASNTKDDDLVIISNAVGTIPDDAGDAIATATPLNLPAAEQTGVVQPEGLGRDVDIYTFELSTPSTVRLKIGPPLGIQGEKMGTSLSLKAQLIDASGAVVSSMEPSSPPASNILEDTLSLAADRYYLVLEPKSYDPNWDSGFGEYGNGGYYSFSVEKELGPDLVVSIENLERQVVTAGTSVSILSTVANQGDAGAPGSILRYLLSDNPDDTQNSVEAAETQQVSALAAGASNSFPQTLSISDNLAAGHHWVVSCVDPVAGELQPGNNCSKGLEIVVATDVACNADELTVSQQTFSGYHSLKSQKAVSVSESTLVKNGELYVESPSTTLGADNTLFAVEAGSIFSVKSTVPACQ